MKKPLSIFCIIVLMLFTLSSCSQANKPASIFLYVGDIESSAYEDRIIENIQFDCAVSSNTCELTIFHFSDLTEGLTLETLLAEKPDSLIVRPATIEEADEILTLAKNNNIPVIFYGISPSADAFAGYQNCWYIQFEPFLQGEVAGSIVATAYKNGVVTDVDKDLLLDIILLYDSQTQERTASSFIRSIEDTGLFTSPLDYSTESEQAFQNVILEQESTIEAIFCGNDAILTSTVQFLTEHEVFSEEALPFIVFGIGNSPESLNYVRQGYVLGVAFENPSTISNAIFHFAMNTAFQRNITEGTSYRLEMSRILSLPIEAVTIENVENALLSYAMLE